MDPKADLNSNVLSYYLNKIHGFLLSDKKVQIFQGLSEDLETFLIDLASNPEDSCCSLDDDCKSISSQLTKVLQENKNVFKLNYALENGTDGKKILMYKKSSVNTFEKPMALRAPSSIKLTATRTAYPDEDSVNTSFKLRCLNSSLKFIKDDTQRVMRFPDMATKQAEFVYSMLSQADTAEGGFKSIFAPITEAIRIFSKKYAFHVSYVPPKLRDMKSILFEKIPIRSDTSEPDKVTLKDVICKPSTEKIPAITQPNPPQKIPPSLNAPMKKLSDIIKHSDPSIITQLLRQISQFLADEKQASFIFNDINQVLSQLITNLGSLCKKKEYHVMLPSECMRYISSIEHWKKRKEFGMKIEEGGANKRTGLRTIKLMKTPLYKDKKKTKSEQSDGILYMNKTSTPNASRSASLSSLDSTMSENEKLWSEPLKQQNNLKPKAESAPNTNRTRAPSLERPNNHNQKLTKSSSCTKLNPVPPVPIRIEKGAKMNMTKIKLLEGLSQPIKSDIGMKMMMNMGWEGGALGLRGEGITEPIMLSLDTGNRAGLGHVKAPKVQPEVKSKPQTITVTLKEDIKVVSLRNVYEVINKDWESMLYIYPPKVLVKAFPFIKHCILSFNKRCNLGLDKECKEISNAILKYMRTNTKVMLTACLKTDHQTLLIAKTNGIYIPSDTHWLDATVSLNNKTDQEPNPQPSIADDDKSTINNVSYKRFVLQQIFEFCKSNVQCKKVYVEEQLSRKQKKYINSSVCFLNKGTMVGTKAYEMELIKNISSVMTFHFDVDIDDNTSFILRRSKPKISVNSRLCNYVSSTQTTSSVTTTNQGSDIISAKTLQISVVNDFVSDKIGNQVKNNDTKSDDKNNNCASAENINNKDIKLCDTNSSSAISDIGNKKVGFKCDNNVGANKTPLKTDVNVNKSVKSAETTDRSATRSDKIATGNSTITAASEIIDLTSDDHETTINIITNLCNAFHLTSDKFATPTVSTTVATAKDDTTVSRHKTTQDLSTNNNSYFKISPKNHKMTVKLNCFAQESLFDIFRRLSLFNTCLDISEWIVTQREQFVDYAILYVTVDKNSFEYIKSNDFELYFGLHMAVFSMAA